MHKLDEIGQKNMNASVVKLRSAIKFVVKIVKLSLVLLILLEDTLVLKQNVIDELEYPSLDRRLD